MRGGTTYLWNKQIIFTDLWVFEIAPSHFCPFQWGDEEGEILTDTKKPGCHFLSDARDKINSPLFQTGRPYQFPKLTRDKSKSNLWTNPNLTRVTNPVGHPGQILRLPPLTNPNACGGQIGFVHRHKSEHSGRDHVREGGAPPGLGWNIHEHFTAWQRQFDTFWKMGILQQVFCHQDVLIECKKFL